MDTLILLHGVFSSSQNHNVLKASQLSSITFVIRKTWQVGSQTCLWEVCVQSAFLPQISSVVFDIIILRYIDITISKDQCMVLTFCNDGRNKRSIYCFVSQRSNLFSGTPFTYLAALLMRTVLKYTPS